MPVPSCPNQDDRQAASFRAAPVCRNRQALAAPHDISCKKLVFIKLAQPLLDTTREDGTPVRQRGYE
jgi:hypothetical protein